MKCQACNFDEANPPPRETWQPPAKFIYIDGEFSLCRRAPYRPTEEVNVSVYACPVCGTLKVDLAEIQLI